MSESFRSLLSQLMGVHTLGDADEEVSVMAGGYVIVSNEETTTIKSAENPQGVVFPRFAVGLLVEMLKSHIPSEEGDDNFDDFEEHEAEERLP